MQQRSPPQSCPSCQGILSISSDMWGHYYFCEDCGFTAEDDDEIAITRAQGPQLAGEEKTISIMSALERSEVA
ncbi:MAG TPA: hypothetical protein VFB90_00265 [Dehalococcoidia bacterium]|nr:hypothetical protein [Dehalococcoidia bacterium]